MAVEMVIDSIRSAPLANQYVVVLKQKGNGLYLPIWIDAYAANAISDKLQEKTSPDQIPTIYCVMPL